jgi:hypothetical protein
MNQKMTARLNGEKTKMSFPGIMNIKEYWRKLKERN